MDNPPEITAETILTDAEADTDLLDDKLTEAVQDVSRKREEVLALAFHKGYDGVDILPENHLLESERPADFKLGFEFEAWNDEPPQRDMFAQFQRYDFRQLTEWERRELLSRIGVVED